jgi:hypothetical protein
VRAKSYPTHIPTFSTPSPSLTDGIPPFWELSSVKFAALATSFVIGFVAGVSTLPPAEEEIKKITYENQRRWDEPRN